MSSDTDSDLSTTYTFEDYPEKEIIHKIDYILVVNRNIKKSKHFKYVEKFVHTLQERGITVELGFGNIQENVYIKLHITKQTIQELAEVFQIDISNVGHHYISVSKINLNINQTPLTLNQDIFRRKGEATNMERILIMYQLLSEAQFGESHFDNNYGIQKLIRIGAVQDAYPLHDGDYHYPEDPEDLLNDRQLLLKYWASFSMWYKEQPLNLIEKYYGTEVAFYFAWLGLYNCMLIPASFIGTICFLISVLDLFARSHDIVDEICNSTILMCPPCLLGHSCTFQRLSIECYYTKISIIFDNYGTYFFAIFMSFWATAFLNCWKRLEKILKIRWNVENVQQRSKTRLTYKEKSLHSRLCVFSGRLEAYTPLKVQISYYILSYGMCLLLIGVVLLAVIGVIIYRIAMAALLRMSGSPFLAVHATFIESVTSAILQVIFIKIYARFYAPLSEWLTNLENPRTHLEFDNSVVQKRYILGFANNYAGLFYIAFLKGRFYSPAHTTVATVSADLCHPCGCLMAVCVQLFVIMLLKSLLGNILTLIIPIITRRFKKHSSDDDSEAPPQWEEEFQLYPAGRYLLNSEFMEMIIQYGFVTFFVAAFPLAPLCALINNCLQLRLDAYELVTRYRRPVPKRNSGIGIWNRIIESITHLSIVSNAFVLAFTSDFISREIYRYEHNSLKGYIKSTLSVYEMKDTLNQEMTDLIYTQTNTSRCQYKASRHPPDHPHKYQLTKDYWYQIGMRLLCVIVFEHVIILTNGMFSHFIPDASQKLKEGMHREKTAECDMKLEMMDERARLNRGLRRRGPNQ